MSSFRTLALAAALIGSLAAPALAEQDMVPPGATASGPWVGTESRTMLASPASNAQQNFLDASGATGGNGQHS